MLEESKMDKKSANRSSQTQSRASAVDCKKNSDLTHKPWPRQNKKREGPSAAAPKNEPSRKHVSISKGRGQVDKRPRARGTTNFVVGGMENSGIGDDIEPEVGSVFVPGSKKQNWNHLLNFKYPERAGNVHKASLTQRQVHCRIPHRHGHDFYLRAYCQFVIKEGEDYMTMTNPNMPVKWDLIEEIVVRTTGKLECPICLGTPVAGRVGLCSHVYCWPCVLHYATAHEKQPPPCPVCTTPLQVKEMKPARVVPWESSAEKITMRLVRRLRHATIVEPAPPRGQVNQTEPNGVLPLEQINHAPFTRFFVANKEQVQDILCRERNELQNQIMAEIDTTEIVFLEQALEMLKLKEEKISVQYNKPNVTEEPKKDLVTTVYEQQEVQPNKLDWFDVTDDGAAASVETVTDQFEDLDITVNQSSLNADAPEFCQMDLNGVQPEFPLSELSIDSEHIEHTDGEPVLTEMDLQNKKDYFYFYQAEDGQPVFLHSINIRILNASWGTLAAAPTTITGCVLHRETMTVNDQVKDFPYTAHLPNSCSFDIVEIDLQPPDVTAWAVNSFAEELSRRARVRARHEREDRRRERAQRRAMEGPPKPDFFSEELFPSVPYSSSPASEPVLPVELISPSTSAASPSSGLSFAKMASASGTWRTRKVPASSSPPSHNDEDSSVPKFLLSDVFEAALNAGSTSATTGGKKNKKSKQKILFSTGMRRDM